MPVSGNEILAIVLVLLALAGVLLLAYFTTKWLGRRAGVGRGRGNIEILDRQYVGQDKYLMIVRTGKRTMLLGITSGQITKLCDIDPSELRTDDQSPQSDFASIIRRALENRKSGNPFKSSGDGGGDDPKGGSGS